MFFRRQIPMVLIQKAAARRFVLPSLVCLVITPLLLSSCLDLSSVFECKEGSFGYEKALPDDAFKPNDSVATAAPIGVKLDATLRQKDAPDHFKFAASAFDRIQFTLKRSSGHSLEPRLEVVDSDGIVVGDTGRRVPQDQNAELRLEVAVPNEGQYVLRVSGWYSGPGDSMCNVAQLAYSLSLARPGKLVDPRVKVQAVSSVSVTFTWDAVDGASDYVIEIQDLNNLNKKWGQPMKVPAPATSATYKPSIPNAMYRVRAMLGSVSSAGTVIVLTEPFK